MKWIACILILLAFTGCSSSLRQGAIAPQCLTECQLSESRTEKVTVDFRHLEGAYPDEHIIGFKDVLGVYVADILGTREELPQVNYPSFRANGNAIRPFVGHPIDVEKDGTIRLPYIDPIDVDGMTLLEAKQANRKAYSENKRMIEKGRDNIQVTLITPRTFRIHIFRQDTRYSVPGLQQQSQMEISRRWSGTSVFLEPKDASVLSALLKTGGLPGIDALNEIWVMKGVPPEEVDSIERDLDIPIKENLEGSFPIMLPKSDSRIVRIPLTHRIGEPLPFSAEDCLLGDGDVVFLPVRDGDTFLTGGLLPPGRFMLDRDRDVDVIEAITMAQGNVLDSIGSNSSSRFRGGVGGIVPPTDAIIVRRFNRDEQIKIHVDLTKAMNDPSERVVIKAGDLIVLRYKGKELMANALLNVFDFNVALTPLNSIID